MISAPKQTMTNFLDQWKPIKVIGQGSTCDIILVENLSNQRKEVVKLYRPDIEPTLAQNEAKLTISVSHPRILSGHKFYPQIAIQQNESDDSLITSKKPPIVLSALSLEYAPRGDLLELTHSLGHLPEVIARTYFHQLVEALECLHAADICHFDIKPDNVLVDENFCLKLADFGLALKVSKTKTFKVARGTTNYLCPEMHKGEKYNAFDADVFAMGITLFAMISGCIPFVKARADDPIYRWIVKKNFEEFWKMHEGLKGQNGKFYSKNFRDLIEKMLAYDPKDRLSLEEIKTHPWYRDFVLSESDLARSFRILRNKKKISEKLAGSGSIKNLF